VEAACELRLLEGNDVDIGVHLGIDA